MVILAIVAFSFLTIWLLFTGDEAQQGDDKADQENKIILARLMEEHYMRIDQEERRNETIEQKQERKIREDDKRREEYFKLREKENRCPFCDSSGKVLICTNCWSENIHYMVTDQYEHIYCIDCKNANRNEYKLQNISCSVCEGTGIW